MKTKELLNLEEIKKERKDFKIQSAISLLLCAFFSFMSIMTPKFLGLAIILGVLFLGHTNEIRYWDLKYFLIKHMKKKK